MHGGLICIAFRPSVWTRKKIQTRKKIHISKSIIPIMLCMSVLCQKPKTENFNKGSWYWQVGSHQRQVASFFHQGAIPHLLPDICYIFHYQHFWVFISLQAIHRCCLGQNVSIEMRRNHHAGAFEWRMLRKQKTKFLLDKRLMGGGVLDLDLKCLMHGDRSFFMTEVGAESNNLLKNSLLTQLVTSGQKLLLTLFFRDQSLLIW